MAERGNLAAALNSLACRMSQSCGARLRVFFLFSKLKKNPKKKARYIMQVAASSWRCFGLGLLVSRAPPIQVKMKFRHPTIQPDYGRCFVFSYTYMYPRGRHSTPRSTSGIQNECIVF